MRPISDLPEWAVNASIGYLSSIGSEYVGKIYLELALTHSNFLQITQKSRKQFELMYRIEPFQIAGEGFETYAQHLAKLSYMMGDFPYIQVTLEAGWGQDTDFTFTVSLALGIFLF